MMKVYKGFMSLRVISRIFFYFGFFASIITMPFYVLWEWRNISFLGGVFVVLMGPFINGFGCLFVSLIAYPLYKKMAKRGFFRLHILEIFDEVSVE